MYHSRTSPCMFVDSEWSLRHPYYIASEPCQQHISILKNQNKHHVMRPLSREIASIQGRFPLSNIISYRLQIHPLRNDFADKIYVCSQFIEFETMKISCSSLENPKKKKICHCKSVYLYLILCQNIVASANGSIYTWKKPTN